jgi:hypothetical protein
MPTNQTPTIGGIAVIEPTDKHNTSRRAFLAGAPAATALAIASGTAVNAVAIGFAAGPSVDPIFAAIERDKRAKRACTATCGDDDLFNVAVSEEIDALGALLDTVPTSLEEVIAVLAHLSSPAYELPDNADHETSLWNGFICNCTEAAAAEYPGRLAAALRRMIAEGRSDAAG